ARGTQHLVCGAHAFHAAPLAQVLLDRLGVIVLEILLERALRVVRGVDAAVGTPPLAAVDLGRALDAQADRAHGPAVDRLALFDEQLVAHGEPLSSPPSGGAI